MCVQSLPLMDYWLWQIVLWFLWFKCKVGFEKEKFLGDLEWDWTWTNSWPGAWQLSFFFTVLKWLKVITEAIMRYTILLIQTIAFISFQWFDWTETRTFCHFPNILFYYSTGTVLCNWNCARNFWIWLSF